MKGIIAGNAKVYSKQIVKKMTDAGYSVQVFLLNAASMGVPQKRERVFFIGHKKELNFGKLRLEFNEKGITFGVFGKHEKHSRSKSDNRFGDVILKMDKVANTICVTNDYFVEKDYQKPINASLIQIGTFPLDYNFKSTEPKYLIGMSVPPVMIAQIATKIKNQWFG